MMTDLTDNQKSLMGELLKDFKGDAKNLLGGQGLIRQLTKRALESALEALNDRASGLLGQRTCWSQQRQLS
jgi:hypothetical protein